MRHKAYTQLFGGLAARHVDIRHSEATPRLLRISISTDAVAAQIDLGSFHSALRSKLKAPAGQPFLVVQNYQVDYRDNGGDSFAREAHGAFYILAKPLNDGQDARDEALDQCEGISEEILAALIEQLRETWRIVISLNDCYAEHVGPIGDGQVGVRINFSWTATATQALTYNPTKFSP